MSPEEIKAAVLAVAQELFPSPKWPEGWCDNGWGGVDKERVANRQREKADIIESRLAQVIADAQETGYLRKAYSDAVTAASFMQDEREGLGLRLGQCTLVDGVPALRRQRDELRAEVELLNIRLRLITTAVNGFLKGEEIEERARARATK